MADTNRRQVAVLRLRSFTNNLSESLWFIPALMVLGGVGLGVIVATVTNHVDQKVFPDWLHLSTNAAETLLSTIAGATITTVGVVFSIVVLSVQLASGQFSPRVIRGYFRDRRSKYVIGTLSATFAYCVIAIYTVSGNPLSEKQTEVSIIAVAVGVLLGLTSILAIVTYLDHSARRLYVGNMAKDVADETIELIEKLGEDEGHDYSHDDEIDEQVPDDAWRVEARKDGWVQQITESGILRSVPENTTVRLETRVGAFVAKGVVLARVWPKPAEDDCEQIAENITDAVIIGSGRTMQQDLDFGLRQLTDIALRALSPGVNDPTTAVEVIVRHGAIVRRLMFTDLQPLVQHKHGKRLLRPQALTHADYVEHAFDQIRGMSGSHPHVAASLIRTLVEIEAVAEQADRDDAAQAARRQVEMTIVGGERAGLLDQEIARLREIADRMDQPSETAR